ncbi:MAG: HAD family phosphatase [Planctomycetota bacterium]
MSDDPAQLVASAGAIIFDCDGTLTDSMPVHFHAWQATFQRHGIPFSEERFYSLGGMPSDRIIKLLSGEHGVPMDVDATSREKEEQFLEFLHEVRPVEKVVEVAQSEKGRRKMAVASGGYRWVVDRQLEHIGVAGWFDAIVTAEDTQRHKPHPDVFLEAARQMGVEPATCLVFEDADLGVEAANRAGMAVIDVRTGGWGSSSV